MSEAPVRVLVVDDEPAARRGLVRSVGDLPGFEVVRECKHGREAVQALGAGGADVVLLDVEMPELDGFGVIGEVGLEAMPVVVFVTAFDRYALRAFDAHALDYVLKPVDPERLAMALERARAACRAKEAGRTLAPLVEELDGRTRHPARLAARVGGRIQLVPVEEIGWIEAADNYVRLHLAGRVVLLREPLGHLVDRLDPQRFVRVHRSHAVQLDRVRELASGERGDARLSLTDGTVLPVSRRFRAALECALEP